jgi:predicted short-subunit dehydrogenase-like oxidoreductase (DUF2520 family)
MNTVIPRCAVVGHGRLGTALAAALRAAGVAVDGPLDRASAPDADASVVLLAVPDGEIATASRALRRTSAGTFVGHCSGATTLAPLQQHPNAFSLHPLMTVTRAGANFVGATAAVAGSTEEARALAEQLARVLDMHPIDVPDTDRAAYHAAASMASNFLITLEWAAQRVGHLDREALAPLVRATVDNWQQQGPRSALTGPIARGDEATVQRQRAAVLARTPDLADLFDALADATRTLAAEPQPEPARA